VDFTRLRFSREAIYLFIYLFLSTVKYKTKQKPNQNLSLAIKVLGAQNNFFWAQVWMGASSPSDDGSRGLIIIIIILGFNFLI
jgi:hypothetical protein